MFKTQPLMSKVVCTVFWDRIEVIFLDSDKSSTLTAWWHWLNLKAQAFRVRQQKKIAFLLQLVNTNPIPFWWLWNTLSILAGLSYHIHHIVLIWHLLTSICFDQWKMGKLFPSNYTTTAAVKLWVTSSVADFLSTSQLLFIAGKNVQPIIMTMLKKCDL